LRKDPVAWAQRFGKSVDKIFLHNAVKILKTNYRNFNNNNRRTQQIRPKCKSNFNWTVSIVDKGCEKRVNLCMIQTKLRNLLAYFAIEWWLTNER